MPDSGLLDITLAYGREGLHVRLPAPWPSSAAPAAVPLSRETPGAREPRAGELIAQAGRRNSA
jgi:hypothetical protein